jgi:UDP-N-acetylglucosamine/UDP-N-acetylgalactosamine diphosphorylase
LLIGRMSDAASSYPLMERFSRAGQGQVFAFWDRLNEEERRALLEQATEINLEEVARLTRTLLGHEATSAVNLTDLEPAPYVARPESGGDAAAWARARAAGAEALQEGRVAAFTVAGGQGTRLGYDGPKGTFPVTPLKRKPLFQVFAEKIMTVGQHHGRPLHWFIMTSHANHTATEAFFAAHRCFGLDPARLHFFRQGRMPAVDFDGKILLESKGLIAMSPDGHGGSLRALHRSGALDLMKSEGVDTVSYFQVDNPLVRCVDPEFIGWHLLKGAEMSAKMILKAYPEEKIGHFCHQHGQLVVIEYSDLPLAVQREIDPATGRLRYGPGSIAIHILDRDFIARMAAESRDGATGPTLSFHRADKKIATIDAAGNPVKPSRPNGAKFEMFVFDALPFARNGLVVETWRADDFSPVKNAEGVDSPQTAREDQLRQYVRWLRSVGAPVPADASGLPAFDLEVAPRFGYDEASFAESWKKLTPPPAIAEGLYLD